jgi:hypothetical protein
VSIPSPVNRPWIQTRYAGRFYFVGTHENYIDLRDIAAALSRLCRYTGHGRKFYSVAEHSYRTSFLVPEVFQFEAIMHDAAEAYLGDVSTPLKVLLPDYRELERDVERSIRKRFRLPEDHSPEVKAADSRILATEVPLLFDRVDPGWAPWMTGHEPVADMTYDLIGWNPAKAEDLFLKRAKYLWNQHKRRPTSSQGSSPVSTPVPVTAGHG